MRKKTLLPRWRNVFKTLGLVRSRRQNGFGKTACNLAAVILVLSVAVGRADVFNMGGTRNATTGTWTGSASLDFVTVGNPGNAADTTVMTGGLKDGTTGYGAVGYTYQMGKYDVTLGQYCQFLNAVANTTDPRGLYNFNMSYKYPGPTYPTLGIDRSGVSGHYRYSVAGTDPQAANCPIFDVTWGEAARFCNWLQNGQPTGAEGPGTTETGAYTLNGVALMAVTRNAGAKYFIPSENEWYKAAYYNPSHASYWLYPMQSNTGPSNVLSATGTNNANYLNGGYTDPTNELTPVGEFAASPGPYGTYDMGGDVCQWNEANLNNLTRGMRGGYWQDDGGDLAASYRLAASPTEYEHYIGFRMASDPSGWEPVPEPGSIALLVTGALASSIWWWRRTRVAGGRFRACSGR